MSEEIGAAETAARNADIAVVVVGTNSEVESEGFDRTDLELPGNQNELVRRVYAANPNTIVVVNAGAPVVLPWLEQVSTVMWVVVPGAGVRQHYRRLPVRTYRTVGEAAVDAARLLRRRFPYRTPSRKTAS